jgi:magnesium-transporting ATPase (P-type)
LLARCTKYAGAPGEAQEFTNEAADEFDNISQQYARRGMRCLALVYGGLPAGTDLKKISATVKMPTEGSDVFEAETNLVASGLVLLELKIH